MDSGVGVSAVGCDVQPVVGIAARAGHVECLRGADYPGREGSSIQIRPTAPVVAAFQHPGGWTIGREVVYAPGRDLITGDRLGRVKLILQVLRQGAAVADPTTLLLAKSVPSRKRVIAFRCRRNPRWGCRAGHGRNLVDPRAYQGKRGGGVHASRFHEVKLATSIAASAIHGLDRV